MIKAEELLSNIEQHFQDTDKFVVELKVKPGNNITVLIDSDSKITIDDCVAVNRHVESLYDREVEDYNLTVASAGLGQPLKMLRQYVKIFGKEVEVDLLDKTTVKGTLLAADIDKITVKVVSKVKKEIIEEDREIPFNLIKSTKEVISFK